jgi:hypothetical protein
MADGPAARGSLVKALGPGTTQLNQRGILQSGLHRLGHHGDAKGASQGAPDQAGHQGQHLRIHGLADAMDPMAMGVWIFKLEGRVELCKQMQRPGSVQPSDVVTIQYDDDVGLL